MRIGAVVPPTPGAPDERGWIAGLDEASRLLERLGAPSVRWGHAFGIRWPYAVAAGYVVSPGVPVAVGDEPVEGPDGVYTLREGAIVREAAGEETTFLSPAGSAALAQSPVPDLLWFGLMERFVLRNGRLEVEDLFSRTSAPVTAPAIRDLLVRRMRLPGALADGLPVGQPGAPAMVEVCRRLELVSAAWADPAELLSRREGVVTVERRGSRIVLEFETGGRAELEWTRTGAGWSARLVRGTFEWCEITAETSGGTLRYRAVAAAGLDPADTGARTRIAFDLLSDLVVLGG